MSTGALQGRKYTTVKPVQNGHSKKRPVIVFQDQLSLNADQKDCRMLQGEHSAIHSTFIKLQFVIKIFVFFCLRDRLRQVLLYIQHLTEILNFSSCVEEV